MNEGPHNGILNPPSRMHNQGHVWTGGTMLSMTSPNDPAFFYHHANVDRLYQRWLETSGQLYAGGKPSAVDYPAQLVPLMNNACKVKYPDFRVYLRNVQGVMTLEVSPNGNNSVSCDASCLQSINGVADWDNEALTEARDFLVYCMQEGAWGVSSETKTQLFTESAQALRFVLAWPEDDVNAATIPPVHKQFLDPHVFKADLPLAGNSTTIIPHTYESFTLAGAYAPRVDRSTPNSSVFLVEPTMVDRVTQIALAQPDWLSRLNVSQPPDPDEVRMVAIAVDNAGFKLNLKGWTTTHYWGPGLVDQLITSDNPVTVSFSASLSEPAIRCADFNSDDPDGSGLSKCETLNSPVGLNGNAKGGSPWQQLVGQQQLMTNAQTRWESMTCYNTTELREQGFVLDGALSTLHSQIRHCAGMLWEPLSILTQPHWQVQRRPSSSCPLTQTSASSPSRSCPPLFSTARASSNATQPLGPTTKLARMAPRPLSRLGWTGPARGTTPSAASALTSPRTSTLARARVTTSRQKN